MKLRLMILFLSIAFFANAQKTTQYESDIIYFIELNGTMTQYRDATTQIIAIYKNNYSSHNVPDTVWEEAQLLADNTLEALKFDFVTVYQKFFTHSEIKELIELYNNPVAQKYISNVLPITEASQEAASVWSKNLGFQLNDFLYNKGYE